LGKFPDGLGVMQPMGDDFLGSRTFCGSPWLGRGWIERAYRGQGPMPAWYVHNWADNELYWVARCMGLLWEREDLTQEHAHFSRLGESEPAYWTSGVRRHDEHDVKTFLARAWTGFAGHEVLGLARMLDSQRFLNEYAGQAERYWITRYGLAQSEGDGLKRMRRALDVCAVRGCSKVGIFGAGSHTKSMGAVLMDPPAPVVCIIDDDPRLKGEKLWNYPVVDREGARAMGVDAVIISSATSEKSLAAAAEPLRAAGALILRLYDEEGRYAA
jgi:hypothetical protein